ncbi:hypothetical protein GCM10027589_38790 [Actinocorallia lasiicapitis]
MRQWGPLAHAALPELVEALLHKGLNAHRALKSVAGSDAAPLVRRVFAENPGPDRLTAAHGLWKITGDSEPVLAEIAVALDTRRRRFPALRVCVELGKAARPLTPRLHEIVERAAHRGRRPKEWEIDAGISLWLVTRAEDPVLPLLERALRTGSSRAAALAHTIGAPARPLMRRASTKRKPIRDGYSEEPPF